VLILVTDINDIEAVRREAYGPSACCGSPTTLLRRNAGAGGVQLRVYCHKCWTAGRALPHDLVAKFASIDELPEADIDLIEQAATQVARQQRWMR